MSGTVLKEQMNYNASQMGHGIEAHPFVYKVLDNADVVHYFNALFI